MDRTRTNHGALVPMPAPRDCGCTALQLCPDGEAAAAAQRGRLERCEMHPGGGLHAPVVECYGDSPQSAFCYWCGAETPWNTDQATPNVLAMLIRAGHPPRILPRHIPLFRDATEAIG